MADITRGWAARVETLRKPSTGLKQTVLGLDLMRELCRDTQKTQHGIETYRNGVSFGGDITSRHSENPARD